jgi:CheY-like chemotaxis protein/anti-sigma regulatory factor (Ser/Thr protein kinase)
MSEPIRVLVADDNRTDRLLLSKIVALEGHQVISAVDGVDALEKFRAARPQIVLLDALMPKLDGFEVARQIRREAGDAFIPIIFLTSLTEADELARCLTAGGDDFLSKPYNSLILRAKITALDRMRQLHATMQDQRDEIAQYNARLLREQEAAKDIFDSVAHSGCLAANNIRHLISPLAVFNGDVVLAARNPAGSMYVLLGDFTGHGLTASIGAMPLAEIFYGMTQKGFHLADVLRECNRKLKDILPVGYFCCATMVDFNFQKGTVEVWSGGLPDAYVTRSGGDPTVAVVSRHLPLGVIATEKFDGSTEVYELARGDRLLMCTDGLLESRNGDGEMFGSERLMQILERHRGGDACFEALRTAAYAHMGEQRREDDLTLVEVTMLDEHEIDAPMPNYVASGQIGPRDWSLSFQLGPTSLKEFNPLPLLQHVLMEVPALRIRGGVIFTVLSELYTNALDHGVIGLSSVVKSTANGFASYYQRRLDALNALVDGFVRFEFVSRASDSGGYLKIRVIDSGRGFDVAALHARRADETGAYHGRGLNLLYQLCDSLTFEGCGNDVEAAFYWGDGSDGSA